MNRLPALAITLSASAALYAIAGGPALAQQRPMRAGAPMRPPRGAEQSYPTQPPVALKAAKFATIAAASSEVKAALPAGDLAAAGKMIGKPAAFAGTVAELYSPRDHDIAILDFAKEYRTAVTAIVKPANYSKLPSLQSLVGKHVLVTGTVSAYEGRPQIEITSPAQVKIIR